MIRLLSLIAFLSLAAVPSVSAWAPISSSQSSSCCQRKRTFAPLTPTPRPTARFATETEAEQNVEEDLEETTKKYGLEAGLFQSLKESDGESAKSLLKKYGIAYLATSIPLALVSFTICYFLVDSGVDVQALLAKVGIEGTATEKVGTFAIAYAAHKAASPIRFPPTVILTPVVAKLIGKEPNEEVDEDEVAGEDA